MIATQVIRSVSSIGANYREACRARSNKEFISKIGIVEGETDETLYWLELIVDLNMIRQELLAELINEAHELLAIFIASGRTAKKREG